MRSLSLILLTLALACDHDGPEPEDHDADEPVVARAPAPAEPAEPAEHARPGAPPEHDGGVQTMPAAEAAFAEVLKLIEDGYIDAKLDRDALYTGATEGMLARLYQVGEHPVNALLNPRELEELMHDTTGSIVGVGVEIAHTAGVIVINRVIAGGPAAIGGLEPGDRILGVDGQRVHDLSLPEVVDKIRGAAGSKVDLFVQRDTEEWNASLTRATVTMQNVGPAELEDGVAVLPIRAFAENTPGELDAAVADLRSRGMRALVLDVRECPGGMLDAAVAVTARFLARGQTIAAMQARDGAARPFVAESDGPHRDLPIAVLVGPHTASGAEVLADALQHHGRAVVIGGDTLGKDSVEHIHKLANGWGLKLTQGRLLGADGRAREGKGIHPRLTVPGDNAAALSVARAWLRERLR
jgi:carboxyl-terminal processing protease